LPILKFPKFSEGNLLKKYLIAPLWRKLRPISTKYEGKLANCIVAGVENSSLPVGLYACDSDAYNKFRELFEPIIKELHGYDIKSATLVTHDFDISALEWKKLNKTKHCIKYIRASASRNLEGFSFVPTLDPLTKYEIEKQLREVITDEFDVKIPLNDLTPVMRKKLNAEGLMFCRHPSLEAIVPSSKCTEGCFIHYKNDLSQVVWINAEDHVKYFFTQKGKTDLREVCEELFKRLVALKSAMSLSRDQNMGYLTCNPELIGTAFRVKLIVQLEKASDSQVKFNDLRNFCENHGVRVNHFSRNEYEFLLEKTLQLGKRESDMVASLINCLYELLKLEEAIIKAEEEMLAKKIQEENEKILKDMPQFDEFNISLIKSFIDIELWKKYGRIATIKGHSLKDCVKPGISNHKIGLIALDADCYIQFEELFMKVIKLYHEDYRPMDFPLLSSSDPEELSDALAKLDKGSRIIGGYLLWQGNIKDLPFPGGFKKKTREECNTKIMSFLDPLVKEYNLNCYGIEDVEEVKKASYFIDLMAETNKIEELNADWPKDRKVFYNSSEKLVLLSNVMNHVTMVIPLKGKGVSKDMIKFLKAFDSLVVGRQGEWEFTEKFGFCETSPANVGNGFTIKVAVKLNPGTTVLKYKSLADSKNIRVTLINEVLHLEHKQNFKTIDLCIVDVMDLVNLIANGEDLNEIYEEEDKSQVAENKTQVAEDNKEEIKSDAIIEYGSTITELLKEYGDVKSSKGLTAKQILSLSNLPQILIEGAESFNTFKKLYCHGAKILGEGKFDLESFRHKASAIMEPLEVAPVSGKVMSIEVSRNVEQFAFPVFIQDNERAAVAKAIIQALNLLKVIFMDKE